MFSERKSFYVFLFLSLFELMEKRKVQHKWKPITTMGDLKEKDMQGLACYRPISTDHPFCCKLIIHSIHNMQI